MDIRGARQALGTITDAADPEDNSLQASMVNAAATLTAALIAQGGVSAPAEAVAMFWDVFRELLQV